jgi:hypothetical protein
LHLRCTVRSCCVRCPGVSLKVKELCEWCLAEVLKHLGAEYSGLTVSKPAAVYLTLNDYWKCRKCPLKKGLLVV